MIIVGEFDGQATNQSNLCACSVSMLYAWEHIISLALPLQQLWRRGSGRVSVPTALISIATESSLQMILEDQD